MRAVMRNRPRRRAHQTAFSPGLTNTQHRRLSQTIHRRHACSLLGRCAERKINNEPGKSCRSHCHTRALHPEKFQRQQDVSEKTCEHTSRQPTARHAPALGANDASYLSVRRTKGTQLRKFPRAPEYGKIYDVANRKPRSQQHHQRHAEKHRHKLAITRHALGHFQRQRRIHSQNGCKTQQKSCAKNDQTSEQIPPPFTSQTRAGEFFDGAVGVIFKRQCHVITPVPQCARPRYARCDRQAERSRCCG